jgi:hypothetical protein
VEAGAPAQPGTVTTLGRAGRALVYTGTLSLTAKDVPATASKAIQTALAAGGYVSADSRRGVADQLTVSLTLRVPSARFTSTIDALAALGKERSRQLGTEDLEEASIDLNARITAQRASVNRVRALLGRANSITELATIERELTTRETELATSEASRRTITDRVAYSTITLELVEPNRPPKAAPKKRTGPAAGLENGWNALVVTVVVLLTVLGWLAPFAVAAALVGVPIWWAIRRFRPRRSPRHTEPAAPADPAATAAPAAPAAPTDPAAPAAPTDPASSARSGEPAEAAESAPQRRPPAHR